MRNEIERGIIVSFRLVAFVWSKQSIPSKTRTAAQLRTMPSKIRHMLNEQHMALLWAWSHTTVFDQGNRGRQL